MYPKVDQFFRIEESKAKFVFNGKEEYLDRDDDKVVMPAGVHHNVIIGSATQPLKIYTIYTPSNQPEGTA